MSSSTKTKTMDVDWGELLDLNFEVPPEGWRTVREVSVETDTEIETVRRRLKNLVRSGKMKSDKFRGPSGKGDSRVMTYYGR